MWSTLSILSVSGGIFFPGLIEISSRRKEFEIDPDACAKDISLNSSSLRMRNHADNEKKYTSSFSFGLLP